MTSRCRPGAPRRRPRPGLGRTAEARSRVAGRDGREKVPMRAPTRAMPLPCQAPWRAVTGGTGSRSARNGLPNCSSQREAVPNRRTQQRSDARRRAAEPDAARQNPASRAPHARARPGSTAAPEDPGQQGLAGASVAAAPAVGGTVPAACPGGGVRAGRDSDQTPFSSQP